VKNARWLLSISPIVWLPGPRYTIDTRFWAEFRFHMLCLGSVLGILAWYIWVSGAFPCDLL
jgi:hypothetical protein